MQYEFIFDNSLRNNASYFKSPLELLLQRNVLNPMHFSCVYLNMKIQQHEVTSVLKKRIRAWHLGVHCATICRVPCNVAKIYTFNIG